MQTKPLLNFLEGNIPLESHKALLDLKCYYNTDGMLLDITTKKPPIISTPGIKNAIRLATIQYVQEYMVKIQDLVEDYVPCEEDNGGLPGKCNIFRSKNLAMNDKGCLVLIQGTGEVRAGIWSRGCCLNASLDIGSMIPYINWANNMGFSILIMNPNMRIDPDTGKSIKYCQSMDQHCLYVWKTFMKTCRAKNVYIVAHSAGGYCLTALLAQNTKEFIERVRKVALTDSFLGSVDNPDAKKFIHERTIHFAASAHPLGHPLGKEISGMPKVSAGHPKHEYTSGCAKTLIFNLFEKDYSGQASK